MQWTVQQADNHSLEVESLLWFVLDINCSSPGSMHDAGCLGLVHWDDLEGWYGDGGGRRVQDGEHM